MIKEIEKKILNYKDAPTNTTTKTRFFEKKKLNLKESLT